MEKGRSMRMCVCMCASVHACVCISLHRYMPAHVFLCVQCVFLHFFCSYANNIKDSCTAGITKRLRGQRGRRSLSPWLCSVKMLHCFHDPVADFVFRLAGAEQVACGAFMELCSVNSCTLWQEPVFMKAVRPNQTLKLWAVKPKQ